MLVNLSPRKDFISYIEQWTKRKKKLNFKFVSNKDIREEKKERFFKNYFGKTKYIGVYYSYRSDSEIDEFSKQKCPRGTEEYYKKLNSFEDSLDRMYFEKNHWDYGIADNIEQVIEYYYKNEKGYFKGNHVILYYEINKNANKPHSGWRWHKWGEYIGIQNNCCEYLNDEPEIERVICFNIYKII